MADLLAKDRGEGRIDGRGTAYGTQESPHRFVAYVDTERIHLGNLGHGAQPSDIDPNACVSRELGPSSRVFYFHSGALVFWNVEPHQQKSIVQEFHPDSHGPSYREEFQVHLHPDKAKVGFNHLSISHLTQSRAEVVASVLAQSAVMEHYESETEKIWSKLDLMTQTLQLKGKVPLTTRKLHMFFGEAMTVRSAVVRALHLLDRPELIWEDPLMDEIFDDLRASFDLQERFQALEYKLGLIQDNLELLVDTVRDRRAFWLEFTIVALITLEVIMGFIR